VSARNADAGGKGTVAGRDSTSSIPTVSFRPSAIPDQFTHDYHLGPKTLIFDRIILIFEKNSHKCLSMNNLHTKLRFSKSNLIKPNQA
jgi:hypothetical protein